MPIYLVLQIHLYTASYNQSPDIRSHVFVMDEAGDNVYAFILNVNGKPEEVLIETNDRVMEHIGSFFRGKLKK